MRKVIDTVVTVGGYASAALIGFITLLLIYEVVTRYFLHDPSIWSLDFVMYTILFITFSGAAWVLKEEGHVKVEIFTSRLDAKSQGFVTGVTSTVAFLGCAIFFWEATKLTWEAYQSGQFIERSIIVPSFLIQGIMPIGTLLLCIQLARRAWQHFCIFYRAGQKHPTG